MWFVREQIVNLDVGNWGKRHSPDCRDDLEDIVKRLQTENIQTHSDRI